MPRGRTLIRLRSHQEQKRRRLLMLGVPLLAIGSSLIWYISSQNSTQAESAAPAPVAVINAPAPAETPPLAERQDSPPPIPQEEPNAVIATTTTPTAPVALTTSSTSAPTVSVAADPVITTTSNTSQPAPVTTAASNTSQTAPVVAAPSNTNQTAPVVATTGNTNQTAPVVATTSNTNQTAPVATATSNTSTSQDVPIPASTSIGETLATLNKTNTPESTPTPVPIEAAPSSTVAQNSPAPAPESTTTNTTTAPATTSTSTVVASSTPVTSSRPVAEAPTAQPTPPLEISLVNEPTNRVSRSTNSRPTTSASAPTPAAVPTAAPVPVRSAPTVVINANARSDSNNGGSKVSSTTLLALSGGIPLSAPRTIIPPVNAAGYEVTTRQAGTPTNNPNAMMAQGNGWIYAGQFSNGIWVQRGLVIGDQLPAQGQRYRLVSGAKLRDAPPGRRAGSNNLGETIGFVGQGQSIQVVQIKNSGKSGHIWLQVVAR